MYDGRSTSVSSHSEKKIRKISESVASFFLRGPKIGFNVSVRYMLHTHLNAYVPCHISNARERVETIRTTLCIRPIPRRRDRVYISSDRLDRDMV